MDIADMPHCLIGSGCDEAQSCDELISLLQVEIDLIEEGQDSVAGYSKQDVRAIRRYLAANIANRAAG